MTCVFCSRVGQPNLIHERRENVVTDVNSVQVDTFDLLSITNLQATDQETKDCLRKLKSFPLTNDSLTIYCGVSLTAPRPVLPKKVFDSQFSDNFTDVILE